jgi:hypothetical protein
MTVAAYLNPDEIIRDFAGTCRRYGGVGGVGGVRLFCRAEQPQRVFCMVNMTDGAATAANAVQGYVSGTTVCSLVSVPPGFLCGRRKEGQLAVALCDDCHMADERTFAPL